MRNSQIKAAILAGGLAIFAACGKQEPKRLSFEEADQVGRNIWIDHVRQHDCDYSRCPEVRELVYAHHEDDMRAIVRGIGRQLYDDLASDLEKLAAEFDGRHGISVTVHRD